jgi:hypothetical protein
MLRRWIFLVFVMSAVVVVAAQVLGTVNLPKAVMADGKRLPAGTYQVRLTSDAPTPGVGQSPGSERWIEFVRNGTVAGREVATVIPAGDINAVAKGPSPSVNRARVDVLKGGEYIRLWMNRGTEHYIIHMPPAP